MAEVTARLAREVGFDSFADLDVTPTALRPTTDGQMTVVFAEDLDDATIELIRERMSTRDDTEATQRRSLAAIYADIEAMTPPTNANMALIREALLTTMRLALGREAAGGEADATPPVPAGLRTATTTTATSKARK